MVFKDFGRIEDPDLITRPGMYHAFAGSTNAPELANGYMYIFFISGGREAQLAFVNGISNNYYIRTKAAGGIQYSDWLRIATSSDLDKNKIIKINKTISHISPGGYVDVVFDLSNSLQSVSSSMILPTSHTKLLATLIDKNVSSLTFAIYNMDTKEANNITVDGMVIGVGK